jgi:hypothetical protein
VYDKETEDGMGSKLRWELDFAVLKYCNEHCPEKAEGMEFYKKGGVYEHIRAIIKEVCGDAT